MTRPRGRSERAGRGPVGPAGRGPRSGSPLSGAGGNGCGMTAVVLAPLLPVLLLAALLRHAISLAGSRLGVRSSRPGPKTTRAGRCTPADCSPPVAQGVQWLGTSCAGEPSGTAAGRAGSDRRTSPVPPAVTSLTAGGPGD